MTIGKRIRELRQAKDWTLAELAKRAGVALSSLSRIETGKMTGTLESHIQVSRAFGIRLPELYADLDSSITPVEVRKGGAEAKRFSDGKGAGLATLFSGSLHKRMFPVWMSLLPGRSTQREQSPAGTEGFLYLMQGRLELAVGNEKIPVSAGDSAYLQVSLPHSFRNIGAGKALALFVTCPPSL